MERKKIQFSAKIAPVEKINDEFLKCKVYVCALGKNRNLSHISRDAADEAEYSLYNIPVIGHLYEDEDGNLHMGGHDMEIKQDANGNYLWKSVCVPYGVLPTQDTVHYEDIKEPNGEIKTYIVAYCILWIGRFPELAEAAYSEDWLFSQSMEINVNDYAPLEEDKNYTDILHYTYSALCLLGKSDDKEFDTPPCFPESKVSLAYDLVSDGKFAQLMEEMRKDLSEVFSGKDCGKEGEAKMTPEERDAILAEYGVALEGLNFEITEDMSSEEFRAKVATFAVAEAGGTESTAETSEGQPATEPEPTPETDQPEENGDQGGEYAFTYREKAEALSKAMPNSNNVWYWVCDFDDKYAYVERTSYDKSGNCSEERGRFEYAYDEAARTAEIVSDFETMFVRWLTKDEDAAINAMRGQYEELMAYKADREKRDKEHALDAALEPFADLAGNEEFDAIVANKYTYDSVDALQNACYIIRGKFGLVPKATKATEPSVPVGAPRVPSTLRERFHEEFGRK